MEERAKILLIDDDPDFVTATKKVLESKPYEVIVAYNGEEGLQKTRDEKPDLILLDIIMPLAKPVIATLAIFNFIWAWSDLFGPLIYLNTMSKFTLPLGLATLRLNAEKSSRWELVMCGAVVSIIPPLVIFFLGQNYFVQGIALSGIKG